MRSFFFWGHHDRRLPWRAAVIGGIGKTTLATQLGRRMIQARRLDEVKAARMTAATTPGTIHEALNAFLLLAGDDCFNRVIHEVLPNEQKTAVPVLADYLGRL